MPKLPQVVDRLGYCPGVIDPDAAQVALRSFLIEEHSRNIMRHQLLNVLCIHHRSHHGGASHLVFDHLSHCSVNAVGSVFGVTKHNFEAFRQCRLFETPHNFGEKGVGNFGNDESKQIAASMGKAASVNVLVVPQLAGHFQDALPRFRINKLSIVQHAGDGGFRHPSTLRYITHSIRHAIASAGTRLTDRLSSPRARDFFMDGIR